MRSARDSGRKLILVAHSLGSLIAYRTLNNAAAQGAPISVARLVTVGSQLPYRSLVASFLPDSSAHAFPIGVNNWVNAVGLGDLLAFSGREERDPSFHNKDGLFTEVHVATDPSDRHSAVAYLKNPIVALAIAKGWCDAFFSSNVAERRDTMTPHVRDVTDKCHRLRYWFVSDVHDELTPERYPEEPIATILARFQIAPATSPTRRLDISLYIPALALLEVPLLPYEFGLELGPIQSRRRVVARWALAPPSSRSLYVVAGVGRGFASESIHAGTVALAGLGYRRPLSRQQGSLFPSVGLFAEYRREWLAGKAVGEESSNQSFLAGIALDVGSVISLVGGGERRKLQKLATRTFDSEEECSDRSVDSVGFCVRYFRLRDEVRQRLALIASTRQSPSADTQAVVSLLTRRSGFGALFGRGRTGMQQLAAAAGLLRSDRSNLQRSLATMSGVRPDYVEADLWSARRLDVLDAAVPWNRGPENPNLTVVVHIPSGDVGFQSVCRDTRASDCTTTVLWGRPLSVALAIVKQRRKASP